jgi:hypothetical protein
MIERSLTPALLDRVAQHLVSMAADFQADGVASLKLVFGGDRRQRRSEVDIVPWRDIQHAGWE